MSVKSFGLLSILFVLVVAAMSAAAADVQVYWADFNGPRVATGEGCDAFNGATINETLGGWDVWDTDGGSGQAEFGLWGAWRSANRPTLRIDNVPDHTTVTLAFNMKLYGTWHGDVDGDGVADNADGDDQMHIATWNGATSDFTAGFSVKQAWFIGGVQGTVLQKTVTFAHTGSSLGIWFIADQNGPGQEGYWLDNVSVFVTPAAVPEPGSLLALGTGMICLFGLAVRRRK